MSNNLLLVYLPYQFHEIMMKVFQSKSCSLWLMRNEREFWNCNFYFLTIFTLRRLAFNRNWNAINFLPGQTVTHGPTWMNIRYGNNFRGGDTIVWVMVSLNRASFLNSSTSLLRLAAPSSGCGRLDVEGKWKQEGWTDLQLRDAETKRYYIT